MKSIFSAFFLLFGIPAFAADLPKPGAPLQIHCSISTEETTDSIDAVMEMTKETCKSYGCDSKMSRLLQHSVNVPTRDVVFECRKSFNGKVQSCEAVRKDVPDLYVRYHFNTQNGGLELVDAKTGFSSYSSWLQLDHLTQSGYLQVKTSLINLNGGLLGKPRVFQVEAGCFARFKDFESEQSK